MQIPHEMSTITEILAKLRSKKMDNEFRCYDKGFSVNKVKFYQPEELMIVKTYRFEGISDPADMSILYIIEAKDGLIGYSLDAYGVYTNHENECNYDNFIRRIPLQNHGEQILFEL